MMRESIKNDAARKIGLGFNKIRGCSKPQTRVENTLVLEEAILSEEGGK